MSTQIIIGPGPDAQVQYADPHGFKFYKLIDDVAPPAAPVRGSIHYHAGVGSESFCLADDLYYRKWPDGSWANSEP